jgi:hypothetical protein
MTKGVTARKYLPLIYPLTAFTGEDIDGVMSLRVSLGNLADV